MAVTNLKGTKWVFNSQISMSPLQGDYNEFTFDFYLTVDPTVLGGGFMFIDDSGDFSMHYTNISAAYIGNAWESDDFKSIEITDGPDITNPDLIAWLEANAVQQVEPEPTETNTFSIGSLPISNVYFGLLQAKKIYLGNSLVWEKETEPTPENALLAQDGALLVSGGGYLITTEVTLISFTIQGTSYQAEEGMTWGEWCDSEYNTNSTWRVNGSYIASLPFNYIIKPVTMYDSGSYVMKNAGGVYASDTIVEDYAYIGAGIPGGGSNN